MCEPKKEDLEGTCDCRQVCFHDLDNIPGRQSLTNEGIKFGKVGGDAGGGVRHCRMWAAGGVQSCGRGCVEGDAS